MRANAAVVLNELLAEVESYVTGAMHTFAEVPSVLGRIDAGNELDQLHDRNTVLATLSTNLREASREIQSIREAIGKMVEASEKAGAA